MFFRNNKKNAQLQAADLKAGALKLLAYIKSGLTALLIDTSLTIKKVVFIVDKIVLV